MNALNVFKLVTMFKSLVGIVYIKGKLEAHERIYTQVYMNLWST